MSEDEPRDFQEFFERKGPKYALGPQDIKDEAERHMRTWTRLRLGSVTEKGVGPPFYGQEHRIRFKKDGTFEHIKRVEPDDQ
ncbi:MAG: hypothetical protein V3S20_06500 [Dehalococcoidia bacterium]